jgi:cytochrome c-type biogenesis protein CcmH
MALRRFFWTLCVVCSTLLASRPLAAQPSAGESTAAPETAWSIAKHLMCPCPSCAGKAMDQCEAGCADGKKHRDEVAGLLKEGKNREQILQFMSATYGPAILGEPPREGWGILSLAVPIACIAGGALALGIFTRGRKKGRSKAKAAPVNEADDARVAAALRDYDY